MINFASQTSTERHHSTNLRGLNQGVIFCEQKLTLLI
jgi:hypothetical protein